MMRYYRHHDDYSPSSAIPRVASTFPILIFIILILTSIIATTSSQNNDENNNNNQMYRPTRFSGSLPVALEAPPPLPRQFHSDRQGPSGLCQELFFQDTLQKGLICADTSTAPPSFVRIPSSSIDDRGFFPGMQPPLDPSK